jgi:CRP/FNR family transcriptional regulator, anaerobic regulatory protein
MTKFLPERRTTRQGDKNGLAGGPQPSVQLHVGAANRLDGDARIGSLISDAEMDAFVYRPLFTPASKVTCSGCSLRAICLPAGLRQEELKYVDSRLVTQRRKVSRGEALFSAGDRFDALYVVWTGFFKTCFPAKDGRYQVTGFQMCGELLGFDGIDSGRHQIDAIALEDSQVCAIRFEDFESLALEVASLQQQFHRMMSGEIVRSHGLMMQLGSMNSEERMAAFLLDLTQRLQARGFSASSVMLRMSREEIGSLLGLTIETVSRIFSKFNAEGLLSVRSRQLMITNPCGLQQRLDGTNC